MALGDNSEVARRVANPILVGFAPALLLLCLSTPACGAVRAGNARANVRAMFGCEDAAVREGPDRSLTVSGCGRRRVRYYCARQWVACVDLAMHARQRHSAINQCPIERVQVREIERRVFVTRGCGPTAVQRCGVSHSGRSARCRMEAYAPRR